MNVVMKKDYASSSRCEHAPSTTVQVAYLRTFFGIYQVALLGTVTVLIGATSVVLQYPAGRIRKKSVKVQGKIQKMVNRPCYIPAAAATARSKMPLYNAASLSHECLA